MSLKVLLLRTRAQIKLIVEHYVYPRLRVPVPSDLDARIPEGSKGVCAVVVPGYRIVGCLHFFDSAIHVLVVSESEDLARVGYAMLKTAWVFNDYRLSWKMSVVDGVAVRNLLKLVSTRFGVLDRIHSTANPAHVIHEYSFLLPGAHFLYGEDHPRCSE